MQRLDFRAMGCQMLALADSDLADATEQLALVPEWFEEWENALSRFRENSELNALNRAQGKLVHVSETMAQVIQASINAAQTSKGLIVPTLLDALKTAGYNRSFELIGASDEPTQESQIIDWRSIEFDQTNRTVRLPMGMHLDSGGVAKGWAADQAATRLAPFTPALIDAGGDIAITARTNDQDWTIGIADPFNPEIDLNVLMIKHGGVATSGRDYRRWQRNGKWQHHIIDPRTGDSAETDVMSATVIAPSTQEAEIAAKVALILGSRAGPEWIEERETLAGLLVLENGQVIHSTRMENFIWRETEE